MREFILFLTITYGCTTKQADFIAGDHHPKTRIESIKESAHTEI